MLVFTDEDGKTYRVTADTPHQDVNAYYGLPMAHCQYEDLGGGAYFIHFLWDSNDPDQLTETESKSMALDQLMRFELDGQHRLGHLRVADRRAGLPALPELAAMDMSAFTQDKTPVDRAARRREGVDVDA